MYFDPAAILAQWLNWSATVRRQTSRVWVYDLGTISIFNMRLVGWCIAFWRRFTNWIEMHDLIYSMDVCAKTGCVGEGILACV